MRTLIVGLLAVGRGKTEQPVNADEGKHDYGKQSPERPTPTDQNTTKAKSVKELTKEDVVGAYEGESGFAKYVILENGTLVRELDGMREEMKWKLVGKEVHISR